MSDCRTMDANYCTPDGKSAALFIDVDGTILVCNPLFDEAARAFSHFMSQIGFNPAEVHETFKKFNHEFSDKFGFELDVYGNAMVEVYRHMVKTKRRRFSTDRQAIDERIIRSLGMSPYFRKPQVFPECAEVLRRAKHSFKLFAVSIGNREAQKYKVHRANLPGFEEPLIFTAWDNKPQYVKAVMEDMNISPKYSAFIGNSPRSDGACLAVTNFIYLPIEAPWSYDAGFELPKNTGFDVFEASDWRECEEKGINRLLRRRRALMPGGKETQHKDGCCKDNG